MVEDFENVFVLGCGLCVVGHVAVEIGEVVVCECGLWVLLAEVALDDGEITLGERFGFLELLTAFCGIRFCVRVV